MKQLSLAAQSWTAQLRDNGYCIIPNALPRRLVEGLDADLAESFERTPFGQGGFYGATTKRFGRLLTRSSYAKELVQHPLILEIVGDVLLPWCDCIQLNVAQAIAVHPGAAAQVPHRDQEMWRGTFGEIEYLVNVIWPLSPFTAEKRRDACLAE